MAKIFYILGAIPFVLLGGLHLIYSLIDTVRPSKIVPRNAALIGEMKASALRITRETDMWRAWLGFNLSHGLGVMFFGFVYLVSAATNFALLAATPALMVAAPLVAIVYLVLSLKYFFRIPRSARRSAQLALRPGCFSRCSSLAGPKDAS